MRTRLGAPEVTSQARVVGAVLDDLAGRNDGALAAVLFEGAVADRVPHEDLRVLVNGRSIVFLDGLETELAEEDTVTLHASGARGYPGG